MGHFRTDDDYIPMSTDTYPVDSKATMDGYDNPEIGNIPGDYGNVKKLNVFAKILNALKKTEVGANMDLGLGMSKEGMLEKVFLALYVIIMVVIAFNITTVLDTLFYVTMSVLQYVIIILVVLALVYVFVKYVLHIR